MNFDEDLQQGQDLLADFDDEPELSDPQWRFKERVNRLMKMHNRTKAEAEAIVETVIRTKETDKRCECGAVAQFVLKQGKEIVCGSCLQARGLNHEHCI